MIGSHLAVRVLGGDLLLLEEPVETGLGVLQGPVSVQVCIQVYLLGFQRLQQESRISGTGTKAEQSHLL